METIQELPPFNLGVRLPEFVCGNIFVRPNAGRKGEKVVGHKHNFDHMTLCIFGVIHVTATAQDGSVLDRTLEAGQWCLIKAGEMHEIEHVEDGLFMCVYSHRDPQGRVVLEYNGWSKAHE